MKILQKTIVGIVSFFLALFVMSCTNNVQDSRAPEEILLEQALKDIHVQAEVDANTNKIELKTKFDNEKYNSIKITWESDNLKVINTDGTVTHKDTDEKDSVVLKVILRINNYQTTKSFKVTVLNEYTITSKLLLEALQTITLPTEIDVTTEKIELPTTLKDEKFNGINVSWESKNPTIISNSGKISHKDQIESDTAILVVTAKKEDSQKSRMFRVVVKNQIGQTLNLLKEALNTITVQLVVNEDENKIDLLKNFTEEKYQGINVSWHSSNSNIITDNGIVSHRDSDESDTVILKVTLSKDTKTISKEFTITVKNKSFTDNQVELDKAVNSFNPNFIILPKTATSIELPDSIPNTNVKIAWISSNNDVINTNSKQVTPQDELRNTTVTLTATFTLNDAKVTKEYKQEVECNPSDTTVINYAADVLFTKYNNMIIKEKEFVLYLDKQVYLEESIDKAIFNDINITWESKNPEIITLDTGIIKGDTWKIIHEPKAGDQTVTLTLKVTKNSEVINKNVIITVQNPEKTPEEIEDEENTILVTNAKNALSIASEVSEALTTISLPQSLSAYNGVNISWKSNNEEIIKADGTVTHTTGRENDTITLTATISKGRITQTKDFTVIVKHPASEFNPTEILANAKKDLFKPAYTETTKFIQTITLPKTHNVNGEVVNVTWELVNDNHFNLEGDKLTLTRDLIEITGSIKATLSYQDLTDFQTISISLPPITGDGIQSNLGYELNLRGNNILNAWSKKFKNELEYAITKLDTSLNTLTLKCISYNKTTTKGKLINLKDESDQKVKSLKKLVDSSNDVLNSSATNENELKIVLDKVLIYYTNSMNFLGVSSEITEDEFYQKLIDFKCFEGAKPGDVNEAKTRTTDEQLKAFKIFVSLFNSEVIEDVLGTSGENLNEYTMETLLQNYTEIEASNLAKKQMEVVYSYTVNDNSLSFNTIYDNQKKWYEQFCFYKTKEIAQNSYPVMTIQPYDNFMQDCTSGSTANHNLSFSDDGTSFISTKESGNTQTTWSVTKNDDNSITINNNSMSYRLYFDSKTELYTYKME